MRPMPGWRRRWSGPIFSCTAPAHRWWLLATLRHSRSTRGTPLKVLVCPEDQSQMTVGKRWIVDKLPAEVRERVVWRERFWLTDEALSTYVRSAGLFGLEMHSPIMCIGNGVPAIVCRFAEQTSKGIMWRNPSGSQTEGRRSVVGRRVSLVTAVFQKARPRPGPSAL